MTIPGWVLLIFRRTFLSWVLIFAAFWLLYKTYAFGRHQMDLFNVVINSGNPNSSVPWTELGTRGDFIGGVANAGVGLASTLLFFAALLLQGHEIRLQRHEMRVSQQIWEEQSRAQEDQMVELREQTRLARQRDDVQLVLTLAAHRTATSAKTVGTTIARRAYEDQGWALDLCEIACAAIPAGMREEASRALAVQLARPVVPKAAQPDPSWIDIARGTIEGKFPAT